MFIINLFNGSGMELVSNLCQIVFAIAVGFLLVTIFYRGGSLLPCILVHSAINTLGTFASDAGLTMEKRLLHLGVLIAITVAYTLILTRTLPKSQRKVGFYNERYALFFLTLCAGSLVPMRHCCTTAVNIGS